ncbi:methyltransferase domain-containing protein [Salipaludibacillus keqinensis]|uniref:methyltransferase domain-containing protein n=1 Tax=Salipaludibacillus keqinensis TaxID=2045207 RepID=UPI001304D690|nr:methyltransferase domain-containing protein [Salipaludibacillus keqinensis]
MEQFLDRVSEAYYGKLGQRMADKTKDRIHWIAKNVSGQNILDVGCSQGLLSILLGREGKKVTGVDISKDSIDYANNALEQEMPSTQENVEFVADDFLTMEFKDATYDSLIITEVLEHFISSESIVEKAYDLMKSGGQLVITVPFGINDFPDHKRTLYVREIVEEISPYVHIDQVKFFGKWIGFVGTKRSSVSSEPPVISNDLIKRSEETFFTIERELIDKIERLKIQLENLKEKNTEVESEYAKVSERLIAEKEKMGDLNIKIKELQQALDFEHQITQIKQNDNEELNTLLEDLYNLRKEDKKTENILLILKDLINIQENNTKQHYDHFIQREDRNHTLVRELVEQRETFTQLNNENLENKRILLRQLEELTQVNKEIDRTLLQVNDEKAQMSKKLQETTQANEEMEKKLDRVEQEKTELSTQIGRLLETNNENQMMLAQVTGERKKLQLELEELNATNVTLHEDRDQLTQNNVLLNAKVEELKDNYLHLKEKESTQAERIVETASENRKLKEELASQLSEHENLLTIYKEKGLSAEIHQIKATSEDADHIASLTLEKNRLIDENLELKNDFYNTFNKQAKEIAALKKELYIELEEKGSLVNQLIELTREFKYLKKKYSNLKESKMGRMTIAYWGWKNKVLKRGN